LRGRGGGGGGWSWASVQMGERVVWGFSGGRGFRKGAAGTGGRVYGKGVARWGLSEGGRRFLTGEVKRRGRACCEKAVGVGIPG